MKNLFILGIISLLAPSAFASQQITCSSEKASTYPGTDLVISIDLGKMEAQKNIRSPLDEPYALKFENHLEKSVLVTGSDQDDTRRIRFYLPNFVLNHEIAKFSMTIVTLFNDADRGWSYEDIKAVYSCKSELN